MDRIQEKGGNPKAFNYSAELLLGGRAELPRQCWEKPLELCASRLQVLRDCFKKLQLSHLNFGKEQTIHTDCAGKERELLLLELISWHLFMGNSWRPGCPQSTWTHVWPLQQGRAAAGQSCRGGNRLGHNVMLVQPHQSQPGFLHRCSKHTKRCSHPLTKRFL